MFWYYTTTHIHEGMVKGLHGWCPNPPPPCSGTILLHIYMKVWLKVCMVGALTPLLHVLMLIVHILGANSGFCKGGKERRVTKEISMCVLPEWWQLMLLLIKLSSAKAAEVLCGWVILSAKTVQKP